MDTFTISVTQNRLKTKEALAESLRGLLHPLKTHLVPGGYHLGNAAAHYGPAVAVLESWSRTLWGIGPLYAGGGEYKGLDTDMRILKQGIDPLSAGFWGIPGDRDQRHVETAALALSLIIARKHFWDPLDTKQREQLYAWLASIQKRKLPDSNWHFFRILVCTAFRELGLPVDEDAEAESFDLIESCYAGDGWYRDGPAGVYDFYNPFGFHFYGLVYAAVAGYRDPQRAARYRYRARLFAPGFAAWFREDGTVVPYGRSLTYRFAAVSFFSACAFAGLDILPWGVLKGLVLRNLRRWFSLPITDSGGLLSVGYGYPNQIMADLYNAPGSPYWGLKAYLILALEADHPFWKAEELPLPDLPAVIGEKVPGFILSHTKEDVQLLVPGQSPSFEMVHKAEKYAKFAYSARFGFCVSHSTYTIEMTGCDSMLMLSEGDGYWRQRREVRDCASGTNWTSSLWEPWADVRISTVLVSLGAWHVRLHRIQSGRFLKAVEGGFGIPRYRGFETVPEIRNTAAMNHEALAVFTWGASRIIALEEDSARTGALIIPAPNLNIMEPLAVIPVLEGSLDPGIWIWAAAVRAGDTGPVEHDKAPYIRLTRGEPLSADVYDAEDGKAAVISFA